MAKYKECPKYNVLSLRVSNEEKALLNEMTRNTHKSISMLMREAMHHYTSVIGDRSGRGRVEVRRMKDEG
ncbi:MAG: ribbon-helix-helix protein, CopG family [Desulfuromonadales bacterium]|nr:ribbon-helix-helix protein, CopG family [Desulfuromonadales bacterium]